MRKETAADGAAAMVVVLRGWPTQTEVQGWGQREMAQELCELEAADIDTTAAPSTLLPNAGTAEPSPLSSYPSHSTSLFLFLAAVSSPQLSPPTPF